MIAPAIGGLLRRAAGDQPPGRLALYLMLGFSAGLPLLMFSAVLLLRLARHGVDVVVIGYFAWVALVPVFKFAWAPLLDRYAIPGFGGRWGQRRSWLMLAQLGIFASMVAMGFTSGDASLPLTALFALSLAFWTSTLEIAADAWRIELAPSREQQGPIVAANLWGYRAALVVAGSGAALIAARFGWSAAYLVIAVLAFLPFPVLALIREDGIGGGDASHAALRPAVPRLKPLVAGSAISAAIIAATTLAIAVSGALALGLASRAGITANTNLTPFVLGLSALPFVLLAIALPRIRTMGPRAPWRSSPMSGPYIDIFWRFGYATIVLLLFVSFYRMGDVLALTLSRPQWNALGYSLDQIGIAEGAVAMIASIVGVALGGWVAARWKPVWSLAFGAVATAAANAGFAWLQTMPVEGAYLYIAVAADQLGNSIAGSVFVVYLSLLVNPRYPGAQYAFLSGFAFLLPRLIAGASGSIQTAIGYDGFFMLAAALSLAAILFLPFVTGLKPREDDGADAHAGSLAPGKRTPE